ncbi:MAG: BatD family protein [Nibricoccus sp.]
MRRLQKIVIALLATFSLATLAHAQSGRWEPSSGTLAFGQANQLLLIFEGCAPKGQPTLPSVDGLVLQFAGNSSQTSIVNGSVSRSESLTYAARPTKRADIVIPEFSVDTDKGRINVPAANYSVGAATAGGVSLESVATANFNIPATVWAGEVFPIEYNLNVRKRNIYSLDGLVGSLLDWKPSALVTEEWSKLAARESQINGEPFITVYQNTRASIGKPGPLTLPEGNQLVNITTGSAGLGFFNRPNIEQFAITSNKPVVTVRPLPSNAPVSFNGAVGQFTLKSNVVPATTSVGEPITWTLTLAGTGNWPSFPGLPARSVSKDFRAVQPQAKRTPKEGALFEATLVEDVVLIPTKPGSYTLGPVTWSYFDPAKGEYQTVTAPATTVSVAPAAEVPQPTVSAATPASPAPTESQPKPPAMPKGIPRDPLPDAGEAAEPLEQNRFIAALCAPVAVLLALWLWLAFRRARVTDPARTRREARQRALAAIDALGSSQNPEETAKLILTWQKEIALLWQFSAAVPAAHSFPTSEAKWIALWAETERALYRDATPLPADWSTRAREALATHHVPGFSFWQLFRLKNLLPFAALLALGFALTGTSLHAADAKAAYDKGDFAAAEQSWRAALVKTPANPAAHHNLSLAIAQQDRWAEAAAHAAAAFAQNPTDPAIRWNLTFAIERANFAPSVFSGFSAAHPPHQIAGLLSPTQWQYAAILASILAALAFALLLLRAYGKSARWLKITAIALFVFSSFLGGAAGFSLRVYSPLNDARAVVVWRTTTLRSIPTEVETSQKTTPLSGGTVAVVDNNFIGKTWAHLSFPNGQTGWIRSEDLVAIWK